MKKTAMLFIALTVLCLSACVGEGDKGSGNPWGTQIKRLQWGMSAGQIREQYACEEEDGPERVSYLRMEEPMTIGGVSMEITLKLDEEFGLISIIGLSGEENYDSIAAALEEKLSGYRTGAQPGDGVHYQSELVMDQYEKEELKEAYDQALGEGVINDSWLTGEMGSPLIFCELRKRREDCVLTIDATVAERMAYLFGEGNR